MKRAVVLLLVVLTANVVSAEEPVYFADENLKSAVKQALGVSDPNATDMLGLTQLYADYKGIIDPNGIQYAENLATLYLSGNNISDISALSGLTNLTHLYLYANNISDISALSGLTKLSYLFLYDNQIHDISPVSGLTNLALLNLYKNQIIDIGAVSGLTNLSYVNLGSNQISDISSVSGLTNLGTLDLDNNQISDISAVSGLTNLGALRLRNNQISDISAVSGLTNLGALWLRNNQISDINVVSGLTNLTSLDLGINQISNISAVSGLTNLRQLPLHHNNISDISSLSGMTSLINLYIEYNNINDISPLSGLTNLSSLYLHHNNISDISPLSSLTNFSRLYLTRNPLNCPSYDIYIPLIETNNPGIYLTYNPRPEYCDYQPDIDVSPLVYDFGDVNLTEARSILVTISNMGNGDLTLNSLDFTPDSNSDFTITSAPQLPAVIAPEGSNDVEITFTPSAENTFYATLEISSDDPDEPIVQVDLIGVGVVVEVPPSEQIQQILEFFDTSVADGNLVGVGPGNSANKKLNALINMFEATSDLIVGEYFDDACGQLVDILKKCDGQVPPPDFVAGEAAEELANMILELMEDLECE